MTRLSFTELESGQRFTSHRRTLTETDHQLFMMLIGDWSPIHADAEYARAHKLGQRILHGSLGIALTLGLQTSALEFADPLLGALGISEWTFKAPLFIGDIVFAEVEILDKRVASSGGKYVLRRKPRLLKTDNTLCHEGIASALLGLPAGVSQ
ncbi:MAG TPA: MaoC/PaaZ C-terminal domain-containing protein [Xanthobacteraceae bacterium]